MTMPGPGNYARTPGSPEQETVRQLTDLAERGFIGQSAYNLPSYRDVFADAGDYNSFYDDGRGGIVAVPEAFSAVTGEWLGPDNRQISGLLWLGEANERLARITMPGGATLYRHDAVFYKHDNSTPNNTGPAGSYVTFWEAGGNSLVVTRMVRPDKRRNFADPLQRLASSTYEKPGLVVSDADALEAVLQNLYRSLPQA